MVAMSCPVCRIDYEADEQRLKWGRQTTCSRQCSYQLRASKKIKPEDQKFDTKAYNQRYYTIHKELIKSRSAEWRTNNETYLKKWHRQYDLLNIEKRRLIKDRWYAANKELAMQRAKAWKRANPDAVRANTRDYATRRTTANGSFCSRDYMRLLRRHNGICAYCLINKANSIDHVVPLSKGGSNFIGNILPVCSSCNSSKGAKTLYAWRQAK